MSQCAVENRVTFFSLVTVSDNLTKIQDYSNNIYRFDFFMMTDRPFFEAKKKHYYLLVLLSNNTHYYFGKQKSYLRCFNFCATTDVGSILESFPVSIRILWHFYDFIIVQVSLTHCAKNDFFVQKIDFVH